MKEIFTFLLTTLGLISANAQNCNHTLTMYDSWGDGWNNATVDIQVNGSTVQSGVTLASGSTGDQTFSASTGDAITLANWVSGSYNSEISWELKDGLGTVIASGGWGITTGGAGNCGSGGGGNCYNTYSGTYYSSFPDISDFENGTDNWQQASSCDDQDWTRNGGGTPSTDTGPYGAYSGAWYMYTEASLNYPNKTFSLMKGFDFSGLNNPVISFHYHMFGQNMGDLELYANGNLVHTISGQQQTASNQLWSWTQPISLAAYGNTQVVLEFKATTGSDWTSDIAIDQIIVDPSAAPVADFTASATTVPLGSAVSFTDNSLNNPDTWNWTFNGGTPSTSTQQNPTITYNTAGSHTVSLSVQNIAVTGNVTSTETKTGYINVVAPPAADFTASSTNVHPGNSINFTDNSTNTPTSWSWSFTGGTPSTSTQQNPTNITYNTVGTYAVSLTSSNFGGSDTETKTGYITVCGDDVTVNDEICGSYSLNGQTYTSVGTFTQTLTNSAGCDSIITLNLSASTSNIVNFTASPTTDYFAPYDINFTNSTSNLSSYVFTWDFGDGTVTQVNAPSIPHEYNNSGIYSVALTGVNTSTGATECMFKSNYINCGGVSDVQEQTQNINVYPNPTQDLITIDIKGYNGPINVEIYDLQGRVLETTNTTTVSLRKYERGIYFLKVRYGGETEVVRVLRA